MHERKKIWRKKSEKVSMVDAPFSSNGFLTSAFSGIIHLMVGCIYVPSKNT